MPFGLRSLGSTARRAIPLAAVAAAPLILLIGTLAVLHAQSSPSISIVLSPHNSVPQNTAITGTVTLRNLDLSDYSSLIFRADTTIYGRPINSEQSACLGEDTNTDITIDVDESTEVFTIRVHKACAAHIYAHYELDLTISKTDTTVPSGRVELASASTRFSMTRYLTVGEPTATPPAPDAQAWLEPDPTTFDIYVGEWHFFQPRANILLYLNDHLGVNGYGDEDYQLVAPGERRQGNTVEEACENQHSNVVDWRRAINQGLWIAGCKPGNATIRLRHETDGVAPLQQYEFRILPQGGNSAPEFSSETDTRAVPENTGAGETIGAPVTATDTDDDTLTYILGGSDARSFEIVASSGQLRTRAQLDHEDNDSYSVTVSVRDGKDADGNNDTTIDDLITVTISVTDLNEPGAVTLSTARPVVGAAVTATLTDPDDDVAGVDWEWETSADGSSGWTAASGGDSSRYTPVSADVGRYLRAQVSYSDTHGSGKRGKARTTNAVRAAAPPTPTPTPPNRAPAFADGASTSRSIAEDTGAGETIGVRIAATDTDDDTLTYILGGSDARSFEIVASSGQLRTRAQLDHEDNDSYSVTVSVRDGKDADGNNDTTIDDLITVTISVTDLDEPGAVTLSTARPVIGAAVAATLTDPDDGVAGVDWDWETSADGNSGWTAVSGGDSSRYTPVSPDVGRYLRARVSYSDTHGSGKSGQARTTYAVRAAAATPTPAPTSQPVVQPRPTRRSSGGGGSSSRSNRAPEFEDGESTRRLIAENTPAGQIIGDPLEATDREDDTLTYGLEGDDADSFDIDAATGELLTKVPLDYENQAGYSVIVSVHDAKNSRGRDDEDEDDFIEVDIFVTNVDEPGAVVLSSNQPLIGRAITAQVTDPDSGASDVAWTWERSSDEIAWTAIAMADSADYTSTTADLDYYLRATATYSDRFGSSKTAQSGTRDPVMLNTIPRFPALDAVTRTVAEHAGSGLRAAEADNIGEPVTASDPDGDALFYSLRGDDAAPFVIDQNTGQISVGAAVVLDFETRNSYSFTSEVTDRKDANGTDDLTIDDTIIVTVAIANIDEAGAVALSLPQPSVGVAITAVLSDPDGETSNVGWVWERSPNQIVWTVISGNVTAGYTPVTADAGYFLRARASYSDVHGPNGAAQATTSVKVVESLTDPVSPDTVVDAVIPSVTGSSTVTVFPGTVDGAIIRTVAENTAAGGAVGAPATAQTVAGASLTYSLSGTDASFFSIDSQTGQISVGATTVLDYEGTKYIYSVRVTATSLAGIGATAPVTIQVTDVNLPSPAGNYDVNNNEAIELDEAYAVIADYFKGVLTAEEASAVVGLYSGQ